MSQSAAADVVEQVWQVLSTVPDPEIPVLSIVDLGIVRYVRLIDGVMRVGLAPTYSGCPAVEVIERETLLSLRDAGYSQVEIRRVLSPPWTTDWITETGRRRLREYGISPPPKGASKHALTGGPLAVACPRCGSVDTRRISEFGSTPCKAAYQCRSCLEPFEHFKCI